MSDNAKLELFGVRWQTLHQPTHGFKINLYSSRDYPQRFVT